MTWICGWITTPTAPSRKAIAASMRRCRASTTWSTSSSGTYRLKVLPYRVPGITLDYGMAATIIRGDPTPPVTAYMTSTPNPTVGSTFGVTVNVSTPSYVASAMEVEPTSGRRRFPWVGLPTLQDPIRLDNVMYTSTATNYNIDIVIPIL